MKLKPILDSRPVGLLKETINDWLEDNALRLSAALAYYSVFAIAPLFIIAITVAGWFWGAEAARGELGAQLKTFIGSTAAESVQAMVRSASKPSDGIVAGIVGFITLLLGASGIFAQLKDALNTIWEVRLKPGGGIKAFIRERLLSFGMVLSIGFLLLISLAATAALAGFSGYIGKVIGIPPALLGAAGFLVSVGMVTTLFAFIFKVLPDARIEWRNVWIGAALTAVLFEIGKWGLGIYLGRESTASSFGAAGSLVLLLLWVYYTSCILFLGAEFTQVYARATGHVIRPAKNAVRITRLEREQQGLGPAESDQPASAPPPPHLEHQPPEAIHRAPESDAPGLAESPTLQLAAVAVATFAIGFFLHRRSRR